MLQKHVNPQSEVLEKQAQKVAHYDQVLQSNGTYTANQIVKELSMSGVILNKLLH
ncbi:MAG: phage antirepressor KilAC domain-containing protein [Flavobacteriales bacterium AspAUS03]